jgi:magnesium-protoporphyrin O-methyltransferase
MSNCCRGPGSTIDKHFDATIAGRDLQRYSTKGPNSTTRRLRDQILKVGAGDSLLDIGAGIGAVSFEFLAAGYSTSVALDISTAYTATARHEAQRRGMGDRITVLQGDVTQQSVTLPLVDTVVMDRVVCCYPEYQPLLERALHHTHRLFAFSYPRDRWYVRSIFAIENGRRRLKHDTFRTVVHSAQAMEDFILSMGFERVGRSGTIAWVNDVYRRVAT